MRLRALFAFALAPALPAAAGGPTDQAVVFYNARIALREDRPGDVLKLWMLRNALADRGERPEHDADFRSAVWAAMGRLGTCPDGYPRDAGGAGLWPLAMHDWVLEEARRGPPPPSPSPFGALEVGRQQRRVSLDDVLTDGELRTFTLLRTGCWAHVPWILQAAEDPRRPLRDRRLAAPLLRRLLATALGTLDRTKVRGIAAIEARLLDLDLAIVDLETRHSALRALEAQRRARALGVSEAGAGEVRASIRPFFAPESSQGKLLRRSLEWSVDDWMSLGRERRLYLFEQARALSEDPAALDRLVLGLIDDRIDRKAGAELELWIGIFGAGTMERRAALYSGDRGARLIELDRRETGFRERAVIALHRGVAFLEAGRREDALRSFAFAMACADESREAVAAAALSRRWLSFVLSRYETSEEVVALLEALVPRHEYNAVVDDLIWRAALRADLASFDRAVAGIRRGGAYDLQVSRLRLLARGKAGELAAALRAAAATEPSLTLRFIGRLIERIEAEEAEVRAASAPLLKQLIRVLDPLIASEAGRKKSSARAAEAHLARVHAILEGLDSLETDSAGDRARTHSPARDTFAGAIRLAPADPLPWPFTAPEPSPPSPFTRLRLEPEEWRDAGGRLVFGWRISDGVE